MIKPAVVNQKSEDGQIVRMCDMMPYDIGVVLGDKHNLMNASEIVLCVPCWDDNDFLVISLSDPSPGSCWIEGSVRPVRLLTKGDTVTLEVE